MLPCGKQLLQLVCRWSSTKNHLILRWKGCALDPICASKTYFQNNFWDCIPNNRRANSLLAILKSSTHDIIHEGIPLDNFESDFLKEPSFSWNPPIHNTRTAVCKNDIDDQNDFSDIETQSQIDNDDSSSCETDSLSGDVTRTPVEEFLQEDGVCPRHDEDVPRIGNVGINSGEEFLMVNADRHQHDNDDNITVKPVEEFLQVDGKLHTSGITKGISKIS